jgi:putative tricarboxylic transport membrane protein
MRISIRATFCKTLFGTACTCLSLAGLAWEPDQPIELVVPAGAGGTLDQTARLIGEIITKHKLLKQGLVVINKPGGAGAEGFLLVKNGQDRGASTTSREQPNPLRIMIANNNLFSLPLATGVPINWKDFSPVAMLATEPFILWTQSKSGFRSAKEYLDAAKAAGPGKMKMRGTGSRQEDQMLTVLIERNASVKFSYLPFKSPRDLNAEQLLMFDSALFKPREAESLWRSGAMVPQCVFNDARLPYKFKVTETRSWGDVPTCKEAGLDVSFQSLRGVFMGPGVTDEQIAYFIALFKKVSDTAEWKAYMEQGASVQTFLTGREFRHWLASAEDTNKSLIGKSCFMPC